MAESLLQNQRPLNRQARELLLKTQAPLTSEKPYLVQLVIAELGDDLPATLVERLHLLDPELVMNQVEPNLKADELRGVSPYEAALLIAEAMELDLADLGL